MQKYSWFCRVKMKKRKRTGHPSYIAENRLNRTFLATAPLFQKLVTDITCLPFDQSVLYLSSIMHLYNGEIIAYTIVEKQDTAFVLYTFHQLEVPKDPLLHSNQGSVYTSYEYQAAIKGKGIIMSMSRKGTPTDNSPIKTFHSLLKSETFYLYGLHSTTNAWVMRIVEEYLVYFNHIRIKAKLNNQSPTN